MKQPRVESSGLAGQPFRFQSKRRGLLIGCGLGIRITDAWKRARWRNSVRSKKSRASEEVIKWRDKLVIRGTGHFRSEEEFKNNCPSSSSSSSSCLSLSLNRCSEVRLTHRKQEMTQFHDNQSLISPRILQYRRKYMGKEKKTKWKAKDF